MKKLLLTLLAVLMISLLSTLATSVHAGPPQDAAGLWQYTPTIEDTRVAGCNTFLTTTEVGVWTGTFTGKSTEAGRVVIHCSGKWSFNAIVSFSEVTVDDREGTLEMSVVGGRPDGESDWEGKWVILSGTGELANLRGQGTFEGPGFTPPQPGDPVVPGDIFYGGKIHFEPN